MSISHDEYKLQKQICEFIKLQFPRILFLSDTIGNVQLTAAQAGRNKAIQKEGFKTPDLIILQPNKYFHALFLEIKKESPYKKDGNLYTNEHLQAQAKSMADLTRLGFACDFVWTFTDAVNMIKNYMRDVE